MPITSKLDPNSGTLRSRVIDTLHFHDFLRHITETRPQLAPGLPEIFDARGADTDIAVSEMRALAYAARDTSLRGELGATAFVASEDGTFGMARMYATFADESTDPIHVFRDLELAEEWLGRVAQMQTPIAREKQSLPAPELRERAS